ncbi:MAG: M56 family metallopeptidase [Lachnoclostridium sp.]|nr:M56 family metallopeptidase [Lachnospira sp.]MCM1248066.1 M56 family metallopeptidase [Lachnoclostridium sp.]
MGIFRPEIILPVQDYTMAQMHMILEHEITHIKNRDLLWKRICLAAEGLHWFNPLVRLLTQKVIYLEEVICDRQSVENTSVFSVKDYGRFLADMEDNRIGESAVAALCESRNIVVRRISLLADESRKLLPKRFVFPACLALLLSCTMVLSHTAAVYAAEWSNVSMYGTSGGISEGATKESAEAEMIYGVADSSVTEKDLSAEYTEDPFGYEGMLEAKTRYLVFIAQMPEGAGVGLMYKSEEREMIRVGLKNLSTGELAYEEAGYGGYSYTVPAAGNYAVYIENMQEHELNGFLSGYYSE